MKDEAKKAPRTLKAPKKRPASSIEEQEVTKLGIVEGLDFGRALRGNIRAYILARMVGGGKRHVLQISPKEASKYEEIVRTIYTEGNKKIKDGEMTYMQLKDWAFNKKKELLS